MHSYQIFLTILSYSHSFSIVFGLFFNGAAAQKLKMFGNQLKTRVKKPLEVQSSSSTLKSDSSLDDIPIVLPKQSQLLSRKRPPRSSKSSSASNSARSRPSMN